MNQCVDNAELSEIELFDASLNKIDITEITGGGVTPLHERKLLDLFWKERNENQVSFCFLFFFAKKFLFVSFCKNKKP